MPAKKTAATKTAARKTTAKTTGARKTGAAKVATKKTANRTSAIASKNGSPTGARIALAKKVAGMRAKGTKWTAIGESTGMSQSALRRLATFAKGQGIAL